MNQAVLWFLTVQEPGEVSAFSCLQCSVLAAYLAQCQITPLKLQKHINDTIIPALGLDLGASRISEVCARRWLKKLGYGLKEVKKAVYIDGHERPDVVAYRKRFLEEVAKNEQ